MPSCRASAEEAKQLSRSDSSLFMGYNAGASRMFPDPEINFRRKDGGEFFAAIFISPVRDESGCVVQHFVSLVDLSPSKIEEGRASKTALGPYHPVRASKRPSAATPGAAPPACAAG